MQKKSQFHKPQYNYKLKTLIIGASGKIGRYLLEFGNSNYVYTYNRKVIHKGIRFDITKNNLRQISIIHLGGKRTLRFNRFS